MTTASPSPPPDPTAAALDAADWLDVHFAACRPEYEAILRAGYCQDNFPGSREAGRAILRV